jgi:hypothetical protein
MRFMARHVTRAFHDETVHVDAQTFIDCEFRSARMIYGGGELPTFDGCAFEQCEWSFEGPAARTLEYIQTLFSSRDTAVVQGLLRDLRRR